MRLIKFILGLLLFCSFNSVYAQNLNTIEQTVTNYPNTFTSTKELADKITTDFKDEIDKAKAAYSWIAMNIAYDTKAIGKAQKIRISYRSQAELEAKKVQFRKELALKTLKNRKALCEGYSTLFQDLCHLMNIECEIVTGTARRLISEINQPNLPSNHSWNAFKINNNWFLADVTWSAGWVDYSKLKFNKEYSAVYFASDPFEFAMKHLPDDKQWLLTERIKNIEDFVNQPIPFNSFLGKNIIIIAPANGTLNVLKSSGVQFLFKNIPTNTEIAYHFKKEKYGQKVKPYSKSDTLTFSVFPASKGQDELVIYFNGEPALGYKIIVN